MVCYIGVGSNVGNRKSYIKKAIALLNISQGIKIKDISPVYETMPEGGPDGQGKYLNLVLKLDTAFSLSALISRLKKIERLTGRLHRNKRWSEREIDLDILLCGQKVARNMALTVPHPLMHKRIFVLKPLCDLAPGLIHPVLNKPIKNILESFAGKGKAVLYEATL